MGRPGRVGPHENVMSHEAGVVTGLVTYLVLRRESGDRLVQQLEVIIGVVRAGVARTQHQRERLSGRVAPGAEGMKSIAVLCSLHLANQVRRVARASHRIGSLVVVGRPAVWEKLGVSRWASVERAVICSIWSIF